MFKSPSQLHREITAFYETLNLLKIRRFPDIVQVNTVAHLLTEINCQHMWPESFRFSSNLSPLPVKFPSKLELTMIHLCFSNIYVLKAYLILCDGVSIPRRGKSDVSRPSSKESSLNWTFRCVKYDSFCHTYVCVW